MAQTNHNMDQVPRDRNVLVRVACFGYVGFGHSQATHGAYKITGYRWAECFWDETEDQLLFFLGNRRTRTTETVYPVCWTELPED